MASFLYAPPILHIFGSSTAPLRYWPVLRQAFLHNPLARPARRRELPRCAEVMQSRLAVCMSFDYTHPLHL